MYAEEVITKGLPSSNLSKDTLSKHESQPSQLSGGVQSGEDGATKNKGTNKYSQQERALFLDLESTKQRIKENLCKPKFNVIDLYKDKGFAQALARDGRFEQAGFMVIALNAIWIAVDTDFNYDAAVISEAPWPFQVIEHSFCAFFVFEYLVRLLAFRRFIDAFQDLWLDFDSVLVIMMVTETWVVTLVFAATGTATASGMKNASVLKLVRLVRLSRMARMAKLLKAVPELMILIKGIAAATRSVFFTLCLLTGVIYVFGIAFVQLCRGTFLEKKYFPNVPTSMLELLLRGTYLDEITDLMTDVGKESVFLVIFLLFFILIASQTLLNMLVGVLVEVVSVVASVEKEEMKMQFAVQRMSAILSDLDMDHDQMISKKEFVLMMSNGDAIQALHDVGVDALALVDFVDIIFADECDVEGSLSFTSFIDVILQFRGSNTCTVKDLMETQKAMRSAIRGVANYLQFIAEEMTGSSVRGADIDGTHLGKSSDDIVSTVDKVKEITAKMLQEQPETTEVVQAQISNQTSHSQTDPQDVSKLRRGVAYKAKRVGFGTTADDEGDMEDMSRAGSMPSRMLRLSSKGQHFASSELKNVGDTPLQGMPVAVPRSGLRSSATATFGTDLSGLHVAGIAQQGLTSRRDAEHIENRNALDPSGLLEPYLSTRPSDCPEVTPMAGINERVLQESDLSDQIDALQKSITEGHANMRFILNQLAEQADGELRRRMESQSQIENLLDERRLLKRENHRLRTRLKAEIEADTVDKAYRRFDGHSRNRPGDQDAGDDTDDLDFFITPEPLKSVKRVAPLEKPMQKHNEGKAPSFALALPGEMPGPLQGRARTPSPVGLQSARRAAVSNPLPPTAEPPAMCWSDSPPEDRSAR